MVVETAAKQAKPAYAALAASVQDFVSQSTIQSHQIMRPFMKADGND
jgi:hypothetical protein